MRALADPAVGVDAVAELIVRAPRDLAGSENSSLIETFADQLAVGMENARLLRETKEALEQQVATSDVLKAVGAATTDLGPVFEAIAEHVGRLCDADDVAVTRLDGSAQVPMA